MPKLYFVYANLKQSPDGGFGPDLPPDTLFTELAAPELRSRFKLYEVQNEGRDPTDWPGVERVHEGLEALLRRARLHPRAVPIARAAALDMLRGDGPVLIERASFGRLFQRLLAEAMDAPDVGLFFDYEPMDKLDLK